MAKPWLSLKMIEGAFSEGAGGIFFTMGKGFGNRTKKIGRSFIPSLPSHPSISWGAGNSLHQLGKEDVPASHCEGDRKEWQGSYAIPF